MDSAAKSHVKQGQTYRSTLHLTGSLARIVPGAKVTIGEDEATASAIESMGGRHQRSGHGAVVVDEAHNLVTSCYMLEATVSQIADDGKNSGSALERTK